MNVPLNINWQQILLHLLNFVVLFAVLYFLLYDPVKKFMNKRLEYYKNLDDEAKENLASSEKAKNEYLAKIDACENEISEKKEAAYKEFEKTTAAKLKTAEDEAKKIISDARTQAENERTKILREVQTEISDMVANAAEKLIVNSSTSEVYDSFLSSVKRSEADE